MRADEERRNRRDDERKLKRLKADNMPAAIELINKANDPKVNRKRTSLDLPTPQLNDEELLEIVKVGGTIAALGDAAGTTAPLVSSIGQAAAEAIGSTPMRTPGGKNTILQEAEDAVARNRLQTPLLGEDNPELHSLDFNSGAPQKGAQATPNLLAQRLKTPGPGGSTAGTPFGGGKTPLGGLTPYSTLGMTPSRQSEGGLMNEKLRADMRRMQVKHSLDSLPAPENEVEISLPELPTDEGNQQDDLVEDAADRAKRLAAEEEERRQQEFRRQSQVIQKEYPRPYLPNTIKLPQDTLPSDAELAEVERTVFEEMLGMVIYDAVHHPIKGVKPPKRAADRVELADEEMARARKIAEQEAAVQREALGWTEGPPMDEVTKTLQEQASHFLYLPSSKSYVDVKSVPKAEKIASLKAQFEKIRGQLERDSKKAQKLEQRTGLLTNGYATKVKGSQKRIDKLHEDRSQLRHELEVFRVLAEQEQGATTARVEAAKELADKEKSRNKRLQTKYAALLRAKEAFEELLA